MGTTFTYDVCAAVRQAADAVTLRPDQAGSLRQSLDAGLAVLVLPESARPAPERARIGLAFDNARSSNAALEFTRRFAAAHPAPASIDIVYVDDGATAAWERDLNVVGSRRATVVEWWLRDLVGPAPVPVRALRRVGDPAEELATLSEQLDLLVVGTRGRARIRRALTGSVSGALAATTRCPLLIVPGPDGRAAGRRYGPAPRLPW